MIRFYLRNTQIIVLWEIKHHKQLYQLAVRHCKQKEPTSLQHLFRDIIMAPFVHYLFNNCSFISFILMFAAQKMSFPLTLSTHHLAQKHHTISLIKQASVSHAYSRLHTLDATS